MKSPVTTLLVCGFATAIGAASERPAFTRSGHTTDTLDVVRLRVAKGDAVLLDVREQEEWDEGHLDVAKLLPLSIIRKEEFTPAQKKLLPRDKPIYCHCRSGARVLLVSELLRERGYDIRPLRSGFQDLLKAGFEPAGLPEGSESSRPAPE